MKNNFYITVVVSGDFYSFHRRSMLENLAKYIYPNKLIIINRPSNIFDLFIHKNKFLREKYDNSILGNIVIINSYIYLHDRLSIGFTDFLNKINYSKLQKDFNFITKKLSLDNLKNYLIVMHPNLINYSKVINYNKLVFDCYDEFIVDGALKGIESREKDLVNICDLMITSSKFLMEEKKSKYKKNEIIHIPTGIDINLINSISKHIPNDISNFLDKKIIGFAGAFRGDIDIEILKYIIENRPNYNFIFVGETFVPDNISILNKFENVRFVGKKNLSDFLNYLYFFDVAISPHILNKVMISASPYKIFQYLAFNLPIVSTKIPEVLYLKENTRLGKKYIKIADNKEDFLNEIDNIISFTNDKEISNDKDTLYKELSWDSRFNKLFDYIEALDK